jgi:hypothetical protein
MCYLCHGPDSCQDGGIINYSYTQSFGGQSSGPETIYKAFNGLGGSSHSLSDVQDFIVSKWRSDSRRPPIRAVAVTIHT